MREARHLVELRGRVDEAQTRFAERTQQYVETFGGLFAGDQTDVEAVRVALDWTKQIRSLPAGVDEVLTPELLDALRTSVPTRGLGDAQAAWVDARTALLTAFDPTRRTELEAELDDYTDSPDLIRALQQDTGGQGEWFAYQAARTALEEAGLDIAVKFCIAEQVSADVVPRVIERALLQEWVDHHLLTDPALRITRTEDRDAVVDEYRKLDMKMIGAATSGIIEACNSRRPRLDIGQTAVIQREAGKKKKHMPVRVLLEKTQNVAQAIKPCFMMSPRSVSQYLPPNMRFDVVIFDEASQVSPGDAISSIYRGSALVVAGDQKQLPPTRFFGGVESDDGEEWSEESENAKDFESILDLTKASGTFRSLTLRWHYRSRHEALIAFSNASFYDGRLITFPGAQQSGDDVGVEFFHVEGTYRRGTARDNPVEAREVAARVIHHFDTRPALTLGVVTFSEAQAAAIELAVDELRLMRPDLDRFFTGDRLDGFFVKSLESVQGDERDVMIFSIGYGPDENRKITMNFGPLNRPGGWRRLNVAITRARCRLEVVSSISAGDIAASASNEGVRHLRRYLDYAERGTAALALDTSTGGDAESPFEESVLSVIRSWGYNVTPQVGTAGYRIDIGVHHPDHPGVYVLGIECDGYQYHSSRVARDRDRIREQILRGLGWHLHRIWGTAWYRDRNGEKERLRTAIEIAVAAPIRGLLGGAERSDRIERPKVLTEVVTFDEEPTWSVPYRKASVRPLPRWTDPSESSSWLKMTKGIQKIVSIEGPVHVHVLDQRLRDAWDIERIGSRIRENMDTAIEKSGLVRDGDFVMEADAVVDIARAPSSAVKRSIEEIHDAELRFALVNLVRDVRGISQEDLITAVARLFGWKRRGWDIDGRLTDLVTELLAEGALSGGEDNLTVAAE